MFLANILDFVDLIHFLWLQMFCCDYSRVKMESLSKFSFCYYEVSIRSFCHLIDWIFSFTLKIQVLKFKGKMHYWGSWTLCYTWLKVLSCLIFKNSFHCQKFIDQDFCYYLGYTCKNSFLKLWCYFLKLGMRVNLKAHQ